ncbi:MAG: hypothetical protein JG718_05070 [Candidatus Thiothrix moscowensis]|nr:hypothetical protein [Candidatus Thiothrix moscowensis]
MKNKLSNISVLHLPSTVGGNPQVLSQYLKKLNLSSEAWTVTQNYIAYKTDKIISKEGDSTFIRELKRLLALQYIFSNFDIIHFNSGSTLLNPISWTRPTWSRTKNFFRATYAFYLHLMQLIELNVLHFRKIPIFIHYQGDDARQGDYSLKKFPITIATQVDNDYYNTPSDKHKRAQIKRLSKYCSKIYALNPDLLHVLPSHAEFIPYSHISLEEWIPQYTQLNNKPLRIGHAPSHRKVKGTNTICAAVDRLKQQGFNFELVLIEGMSNAEAKEYYKNIDILIDQLFAGWYGGLAVEVMALGKPVIVYIRETDLHFIPSEMRKDLPFINTTPDNIESTLRNVLEMPRTELYQLAKRSRSYVEKWHNPLVIAQRIKTDYECALRKHGKY